MRHAGEPKLGRNMARLRSAFGMLAPLSFLLAACGLGIKGGPIVEVTITPTAAEVAKGLSLQLVATGRRGNGSLRDITATAQWSSSDPMADGSRLRRSSPKQGGTETGRYGPAGMCSDSTAIGVAC